MATTLIIPASLIIDLKMAYEMADTLHERCSGEWVNSIDPESMVELKSIWKQVDGSYSLNQLAHAIRKGKPLE